MLCFSAGMVMVQISVHQDSTKSAADSTVIRQLDEKFPATEIGMAKPGHDPARAALLSAVIPGLGQAYNKKYWKIPVIWAALGAFGYFIRWNDERYQFYRRNLIYEVAQDPDFPNETGLDKSTLKNIRDRYRRSRDQLGLYGILFYFIQIVDAHVDAHLIDFDVNQDLSVKLEPRYIPLDIGGSQVGFAIKFKF